MACCKYCSCCCKRKPYLCCNCNCCPCCCTCAPPSMPYLACLPQMPCLPPPPPPYQVIRERVVLPCPYPVPVYPQYSAPCNDCCPDVDYWSPPCQCRYPFPKFIHCPGMPIVPGYKGHVPGLKFYGAARTFGDATRDTKCIMSQWSQNCLRLPWRVFER